MIRTGTIKNGVFVPDQPIELPEGTRVELQIVPTDLPSFNLEDIRQAGHPIFVEGYPGELADLMRMIQDERDAEVRMLEERDEAQKTE